jgi:N-acetyl-anhydromuramyl-L-alanine amidase AmpD
MDRQVMATENWFSQQPDRGGWGSSADFVVGPDERVGGEVVIVSFGDPLRTFGSWSAGYGSFGAALEWGAAEVGIAIEVAQPDNNTAFTPETVDAVAWLCIELSKRLVAAGAEPVPAVHIDYWDQRRDAPVPRGYIGHDELANGVRLGKTDPGQMWNWPAFLSLVEGRGVPTLSPPVTNYKAAIAAWRGGVEPLVQTAEHDRYEVKIARS